MGAFNIFLSDVSNQGSRYSEFGDQNFKTLVVQQEGATGPRDAQLMFGVGFASMPVPNDRLIILSKNSNLYAIAGASQAVEESFGLKPGERMIFSTDENGAVQSTILMRADGTLVLNGGTESAVKGDSFKATHDGHLHPSSFGPTGVPASPMPTNNLNPSVKL